VCVFLGQFLDLLLFFPGVWFPGSFVMGLRFWLKFFVSNPHMKQSGV